MGHARAGKDTAAAGLESMGFARGSFAAPMKQAALAALRGLGAPDLVGTIEQYGWEWAKDHTEWARPYLQAFGTDAIRTLDPTFWIRAALGQVDGPTVFADCRFANEAAAIRDRGGIILRVDRPGVGQVNGHASELEWQAVVPDAVLDNVSSEDWLGFVARLEVRRLLGVPARGRGRRRRI